MEHLGWLMFDLYVFVGVHNAILDFVRIYIQINGREGGTYWII